MYQLLLYLVRDLTYFDEVELTHGGDEDQVCLKYMKLSKFHGKPQIPVYNSSDRFVLNLCLYIEDATNLILVTYFYLYSASKNTSFVFCSSSKFLKLKFVTEKKKNKIAQKC